MKKILLFSLSVFCALVSLTLHATTINALLHNPQDPVIGNPRGSVTIVEFFDYDCSHCMNMVSVISSLIRYNPHVRVVFKEYPIQGARSIYATRVALAANKQNKYYAFSHAMLMSYRSLSEANVMAVAQKVGLNMAQLKKDMNSSAIQNQIQENYRLARSLNVTGTPVFFIVNSATKNSNNLNFFFGEMSQSELQNAVYQAGG